MGNVTLAYDAAFARRQAAHHAGRLRQCTSPCTADIFAVLGIIEAAAHAGSHECVLNMPALSDQGRKDLVASLIDRGFRVGAGAGPGLLAVSWAVVAPGDPRAYHS